MPKKNAPPRLELLLEAGLGVPLAFEAALRALQGPRLIHYAKSRGLHPPTLSAVLLGRRRDSTVRAQVAEDLGLDPLFVGELLDEVRENRAA